MKKYTLHKVLTLPNTLESNSIYYVKEGESSYRQVVTDDNGNALEYKDVLWSDVINRPLNLSDLNDDLNHLSKSGGEMTGNIEFSSSAMGSGIDFNTTNNFKSWIKKHYFNGGHLEIAAAAQVYFMDSYDSSVGITFHNGDGWGEFNGYVQADSFINTNSSDSEVLLGGGGTKPLSEFAVSNHVHSWSEITGKPTFDNYQSWNLKTNGVQRTTVQSGGTLDLVAGSNVSLSYGAGGVVTINSSYTDTTYSNMSLTEANTGTSTTGRVISAKTLTDWIINKDYSVNGHTHSWGEITGKPAFAPVDAEKNVQVDWNVTDTNHDAFIKNKPEINILKVQDVRSMEGTDGSSNYFPAANDPILDKEVTSHFGQFGLDEGWKSALTVRGYGGDYTTWQLIGHSSNFFGSENENNLYFRTGTGSNWNTPYLIWHAGNLRSNADNDERYLDTLQSVTDRNATTNNAISITNNAGSESMLLNYSGIEFNRGSNYIAPDTNGTKSLNFGASTKGVQDWFNINIYGTGQFRYNNNDIYHTGNLPTYDNYQSWNLKTNGVQRTTVQSGGTLDIVAQNNISASYSAGGVVTLDGTHSHALLTNGAGLTGSNYNGSSATTWTLDESWLNARYFDLDGNNTGTGNNTFSGVNTFSGKTLVDGDNMWFNTQNGQRGLYITRYGESTSEHVKHYLEDIIAHQFYQNDERHARFKWTINNTDTESNGGANANTHTFEFLGNEFGAYLYLDGQEIVHSGNISSFQAGSHTHDWTEITGKPAFAPVDAEKNVNADWNASSGDAQILNKPSTFTPSSHTHSWSEITGKPTYDNYGSWNLKTNSIQRTTIQSGETLDLIEGSNISLSYGAGGKVTINSTDTNTDTTYSAGDDLTLSGTTFNVTSSSGASANLIAKRDSSGDLHARLFRPSYSTTNPTVNYIMTQVEVGAGVDNFLRPSTPSQFRAAVTDSFYDNYVSWKVQVNTEASTNISSGETLAFTAGGATTLSRTGSTITISSTDTNTDTTYSAGTDLTLSGTTFNVSSSEGATANAIAKRDSSGDLHARLFRPSYSTTNATPNYIMTQIATGAGTDNFLRPTTHAQFRAAVTDSFYDNFKHIRFSANTTADGSNVGAEGDVVLVGGTNMTVSRSGSTFTFDASGGSGSRPVSNVSTSGVFSPSQAQFTTNWTNMSGSGQTFNLSDTVSWSAGDETEGVNTGSGNLSITADTGINLLYPEGFNPEVLPNGTFGMKFISATDCVLVGALTGGSSGGGGGSSYVAPTGNVVDLASGITPTSNTTMTEPHRATNDDISSKTYYTSFGGGSSSTSGAEGDYIEIDLGTVRTVTGNKIYFYNATDRFYYYKLKYSEDGVTWNYLVGDADTFETSQLGNDKPEEYTYVPSLNINARYWRVYANGNNVNTANHLYEWDIMGYDGNPSSGTNPDFEPEFQAVLDYASTNGIPLPSTAEQQACNEELIHYKNIGAWDKDDVFFRFKGTADPAFKLICWKRLIQADAFGSLTWDDNGVLGNGTNGYINPKFAPSIDGVNFTQNDAGLTTVFHANSVTTNSAICGGYDGVNGGGYTIWADWWDSANGLNFLNSRYETSTRVYDELGVAGLYRTSNSLVTRVTQTVTAEYNDSVTGILSKTFYIMARARHDNAGAADVFGDAHLKYFMMGGSKVSEVSGMRAVLN